MIAILLSGLFGLVGAGVCFLFATSIAFLLTD